MAARHFSTGTLAGTAAASATGRAILFFPSATDALGRQGVARVINRSVTAGQVSIAAFDDEGGAYGPLRLSLGANETAHFNSHDLENGNPGKGLTGGTGSGQGDWRLEFTSELDIEVLSYARTSLGFLTSMHDTVPRGDRGYRVSFFNPGRNQKQESLLRVVNMGETAATVTIDGKDDAGSSATGSVTVEVQPGAAKTFAAAELESGNAPGLDGALGEGAGKWQLLVESDQPIVALNLLATPTGDITNLSSAPQDAPSFTFDFHRGPQAFVADFADYPPNQAEFFELTSDYRPLPPPLETQSALFISGINHSGGLFMFFKGYIGGLVPGASYVATVSVEIATNTPAGCVGAGGPPGESVWIKAGATALEPLPVLKGSELRMNIDIGNQSNDGEHAVVLGNMANSRSCEEPQQWERKAFPARRISLPVSAPPNGRAWLLFGVDSGFESRTEVYFTRASVAFTRL